MNSSSVERGLILIQAMSQSAPPSRWCSCLVVLTLLGASACSLFATDDTSTENDDVCFSGWRGPDDLGLPVLGAVMQIDGSDGEWVALTDAGRVLQYSDSSSSLSEHIGDVGVTSGMRSYAVAGPETRFAVGDGGQVWRGSPMANDWETLDVGLGDDIHTVLAASDGAWAILATDSQVLGTTDLGDTWDDLERPVGLRAGFWVGDRYWFVGDLGQAWSGSSPQDWTEESPPTDDALIGGGAVPGCSGCVILHSANNVYFRDADGAWIEIVAHFESAIVAYDRARVATEEGLIFALGEPGNWDVTELASVGFLPTALGGDTDEIQIAGSGSELQALYYEDNC